ncbi:hypothetical protein D3C71_1686040 [compost metagenome]
MSTPAQPAATAAFVISMLSTTEQLAVPGISRSGEIPFSTRCSSSAILSRRDSEADSELVPKIASPTS